MADNKFENTTATVFNIQKFCTDDGPGIRTTVFLKGCHLRCAWCHNPEGLSPTPLLELRRVDCVSCGRCAGVCPNGVHSFSNSHHHIDRSLCVGCGKCVESCPYGALAFCGRTMTAGEVLESALADKPFYFPQGGITISGGEPLLQPDFVLALGTLAKAEGIHVCVETSGAVAFSVFEKILPAVDLFLFDVKETDPESHLQYTGVKNDLPLANLKTLNGLGIPVVLRCPIIPGVNDRREHLESLAKLFVSLDSAAGIQLMPYHPLGQGKLTRYGASATSFRVPQPGEILQWNQVLQDAIARYRAQK